MLKERSERKYEGCLL